MRTAFFLAAITSARILTIAVGPDVANSYSPNNVTVKVGDIIVWDFQSTNHDVAQGTLDSACQPAVSPFYSGFQSVNNGFAINITNTDPIWYYCSTPGYCKHGMIGVINPPFGFNIDDYVNKAASVGSSAKAPSIAAGTGGVLGPTSELVAGNFTQANSSVPPISSAASPISAVSSATTSALASASFSSSPSSTPTLSGGAIAGIVVGALAGNALSVIFAVLLLRKRRRNGQGRQIPTWAKSGDDTWAKQELAGKPIGRPELDSEHEGREL